VKLHISYSSEKSKVTLKNEVVDVKAFQIIVWVSVSIPGTPDWDYQIPRIPAILDIGNTHNFAINHEHLVRWAGIHPESLPELNRVRESGRLGLLRSADLWLHTDRESFKLEVDEGIAILNDDWPRLPILGLRALTKNKLQTFISATPCKSSSARRPGGIGRSEPGDGPWPTMCLFLNACRPARKQSIFRRRRASI
jgi:hypothetical protein